MRMMSLNKNKYETTLKQLKAFLPHCSDSEGDHFRIWCTCLLCTLFSKANCVVKYFRLLRIDYYQKLYLQIILHEGAAFYEIVWMLKDKLFNFQILNYFRLAVDYDKP